MRGVIQRVKRASVSVNGSEISSIGKGLLLFLGIKESDTKDDISYIVKKCTEIRIFEDEAGKMNLCCSDVDGEILVVSQFTLYGDCRKGRRPSFTQAGSPTNAQQIYNEFVKEITTAYPKVKFGQFQEMMDVHIVNDGPVTMLLDSARIF